MVKKSKIKEIPPDLYILLVKVGGALSTCDLKRIKSVTLGINIHRGVTTLNIVAPGTILTLNQKELGKIS